MSETTGEAVVIEPRGEARGTARVEYASGTLIVRGLGQGAWDGAHLQFDPRIGHYRAQAHHYRAVVGALVRAGWRVEDRARAYGEPGHRIVERHEPYAHQREAIEAWERGARRGVVVLPTGSGKTYVAQLAIERAGRDALIVVPTIDLLNQWAGVLGRAFGQEIGMLGGGYHELRSLTVSTYDSAAIHMERLGARFGLIVFDEVHHLPGEVYRTGAECAIAPFRLGLTATLERSDGRERMLDDLIGPLVYERSIKEMAGEILADYDATTVEVAMSAEDAERYRAAREVYRGFVRAKGLRVGSPRGWRSFLAETSRSSEGRRAFAAYLEQKRLALSHGAKIERLYEIVREHASERVLIFTNDNASVYAISERMLVPAITHQTPLKERRAILERFNEGSWRVVATSKVLNEGVDVPEASVAIVLSGSGSVREHVQRLGRILRRSGEKRARLYELVTADSMETFTSQRRREHDAYQ